MNKLLITVFVPSINKSYDVYITKESLIKDLKNILGDAIEDLSNEKFIASSNVLVNSVTGIEYDDNLLVRDTNIENGTKIILI